MAANNTEKFVSLRDTDVQNSQAAEKTKNTRRKTESSMALVRVFVVAELKSASERFRTGRFWPCNCAYFFWGTEKVDNYELCEL